MQQLAQNNDGSSPAPQTLEKIEDDLNHLSEDAETLGKDVIHSLEPESYEQMQGEVVHADMGHHEKSGMPQLDPTSFSSQIFWLVVTFGLLYVLMSGHIVPRIRNVLEKRRAQIGHDLDVAEKAKADAEKAKDVYEKELAIAKKKSGQIVDTALETIRQRQQQSHAELDTKLAKAVNASETAIARQRDQARDTIRPLATELAGLIVEKILNVKAAPTKLESAVSAEMEKR